MPDYGSNGTLNPLILEAIHVTITFAYVASGKDSCRDAVMVVDVSTVVIPNETRAGAA